MLKNTIAIVRITQILVDNGWKFIDNGYNCIERAMNESTGEIIEFKNEEGFEQWLFEQAQIHSIN